MSRNIQAQTLLPPTFDSATKHINLIDGLFRKDSYHEKYKPLTRTQKNFQSTDYQNIKKISDDKASLRQTCNIDLKRTTNDELKLEDVRVLNGDRNFKNGEYLKNKQYSSGKKNYNRSEMKSNIINNDIYRDKSYQTGKSKSNIKKLQNKFQSFFETFDKFKDQLQASNKITEELIKIKEYRKKRKQKKYKEIIDLQSKYKSVEFQNSYKKINPQCLTPQLPKKKQQYSLKQKNNSFTHFNYKSTHKLQFSSDFQQIPKVHKILQHSKNKSVLQSTLNSLSTQRNHKKILETYNQLDAFFIEKCLGEGKFGKVFQVIHKYTGMIYAMKKIPKKIIIDNFMVDQFVLELKLQTFLNHKNVLPLYHFFHDRQYVYLLLQYMEEGTLFSQLKKTKTLKQPQVAQKIKQVSLAINYLHQNCIAHRDIKPENILISHGVCKIGDFGWATICSERRKTYCGTFDYAPPEILSGIQYDYTVDLWCLGIMTYELLVGKAPFYHISRQQTRNKILKADPKTIKFPQYISYNAQSFIMALLRKNPKDRLSSEEILLHPFLRNISND